MQIISHPSPNFGDRLGGHRPELIVLHYTAMTDLGKTLARLCDPRVQVSAHYLITKGGAIYHLVDEAKRAWHAGQGQWGGRGDVNSRSIGIELENSGFEPFSAPQMQALTLLLTAVQNRHAIAPKGVIGHSDLAPDRKSDPGARFDWCALAMRGLSVWPSLYVKQVPVAKFRGAARAFGYSVGDEAQILSAFRLRFRPQASGPLAFEDAALAVDLAHRFAVDAPLKPA